MSIGDDIKKSRINLSESLSNFFINKRSRQNNHITMIEQRLMNYIENTMLNVLSDIEKKINISVNSMEDLITKSIKEAIDSRHSLLMETDKGEIYKYIDSTMIPIKRDLSKFVSEIAEKRISKIYQDISNVHNSKKADDTSTKTMPIDIRSDKVKYKINTDLIRDKIMSAVSQADKDKSSTVDNDIENIMSSRVNIENFHNKRGFFDGRSIFGIYNPNITQDQIERNDLSVIHIHPKCDQIDPNLEYVKTFKNANHLIVSRQDSKTTYSYDIKICKNCLKNFGYNDVNVTMEKFCQDFLFGLI